MMLIVDRCPFACPSSAAGSGRCRWPPFDGDGVVRLRIEIENQLVDNVEEKVNGVKKERVEKEESSAWTHLRSQVFGPLLHHAIDSGGHHHLALFRGHWLCPSMPYSQAEKQPARQMDSCSISLEIVICHIGLHPPIVIKLFDFVHVLLLKLLYINLITWGTTI